MGGSSGFGFAFADGGSLINLGIDCGKFTSENFAIKGSLFVLSADGDALFGLSAGIKYYAGGKFILNPSVGILSGEGNSTFLGGLHIGYAAKLADNIYLEPGFGLRLGVDDGLFEIRLPFMLMF